jgi:glucose-6-phosphate-specific signal transduction histidine kinase
MSKKYIETYGPCTLPMIIYLKYFLVYTWHLFKLLIPSLIIKMSCYRPVHVLWCLILMVIHSIHTNRNSHLHQLYP